MLTCKTCFLWTPCPIERTCLAVPYNCAAQGFVTNNSSTVDLNGILRIMKFFSPLKVFSGANAQTVITLITIYGKE